MPARRSSIVVLALALIASVLSIVAFSSPATSATQKVAAKPSAARVAGQPPQNYVIPATSYFAYPNRSGAERMAIRGRVLRTIQSTWGGPKTPSGLARAGNGTIRIATWTFKDMAVAKALVNARTRGVSVQVVAAKSANQGVPAWRYLKKKFGQRLYKPGHPETRDLVSFARECRGSCRGAGGTAHAKYFMFSNVGSSHKPNIVIQSSMNLTPMGYQGQWNQAEVSHSKGTYDAFMFIYRQTRIGRPVKASYRNFASGSTTSSFYPLHGARASNDPVMGLLNKVGCTGATSGGNANGRTKIRIIQYSIYGDRGVWIAKKLRSLWNSGCDIQLIYSVSSRPVMSILRNGSGRGPIPVRQSVITNGKREIVKYNHSKWMTITGRFGGSTGTYVTMSGSANWSLFAFHGDEQVQTITDRTQALRHNRAFSITWGQGSSHAPGYGIKGQEGRFAERTWLMNMPKEPTWGKGVYKYLTPEGE
jgi:phosphatidylserine/phosphatidylglycerophosphate/cardiolipin synthase-like enzyme